MLVLAQVSSRKTGGSDRCGPDTCATAHAGGLRPGDRTRARPASFFKRNPLTPEEAAQHRSVGLHATLGGKAPAQRFQRDVRLLSPHRNQEIDAASAPMAGDRPSPQVGGCPSPDTAPPI